MTVDTQLISSLLHSPFSGYSLRFGTRKLGVGLECLSVGFSEFQGKKEIIITLGLPADREGADSVSGDETRKFISVDLLELALPLSQKKRSPLLSQ